MSDVVRIEVLRFHQDVRVNPKGSVFLGYLSANLIVDDVIANGTPLVIGLADMKVRLTQDGQPRLDFPDREVAKNGETKRFPFYWTGSAETRALVTQLAFSTPEIGLATELGIRALAAKRAA